MNWFGVVGTIVGVLGFAWGVRFYWELRKWAHLIKYGRVVIAYKGKVKLNAPLQEWALWCQASEADETTNGRVIYTLGGTRIAVIKKSFVPDPPIVRLWKATKSKVSRVGTTVTSGKWTAEDHTTPRTPVTSERVT